MPTTQPFFAAHAPNEHATRPATAAAATHPLAHAPRGGRLGAAFAGLALAVAAGLATPDAQAAAVVPPLFLPTSGQGQVLANDPSGLTGAWAGSLSGLVDPTTGTALDAVSVVSFTIDPQAGTVSGTFELTEAMGLASTLYGLLDGTVTGADLLAAGGQFAIDYTVQGGTGVFAGVTGYGLAFIDVDPLALPDTYGEQGVFVLDVASPVSEPGTAALALLALAGLGAGSARRRRAGPV